MYACKELLRLGAMSSSKLCVCGCAYKQTHTCMAGDDVLLVIGDIGQPYAKAGH